MTLNQPIYKREAKEKRKRARRGIGVLASTLSLLAILSAAVLLPSTVGVYVTEGIELALTKVIPTAFPFMILSDIYIRYGRPELLTPLAYLFRRIFSLPSVAVGAYISGNVCGFPIGVKCAVDLYRSGALTRDETERLMAYSNNPSAAFVIGAVGVGMLGDVRLGIGLYVSVMLGGVICGLLFRKKGEADAPAVATAPPRFDFVGSVINAGTSSVAIASFIITFSVIGGVVLSLTDSPFINYPLYMTLEVTRGCAYFSAAGISPLPALALIAFTLGFGGISVMMQSASFLRGTDLGMKRYLIIKTMQGLASAALASCIYRFIV